MRGCNGTYLNVKFLDCDGARLAHAVCPAHCLVLQGRIEGRLHEEDVIGGVSLMPTASLRMLSRNTVVGGSFWKASIACTRYNYMLGMLLSASRIPFACLTYRLPAVRVSCICQNRHTACGT